MKKIFKYSLGVIGSTVLLASTVAKSEVKQEEITEITRLKQDVINDSRKSSNRPHQNPDIDYDENKLEVIRYNFSRVKKGDIFFDKNGTDIFFLGFMHLATTGHVGIVEDIVDDENGGKKLIIIEANGDDGVQRHEVDAYRFYMDCRILRVFTDDDTREAAVSFCQKHVGKEYNWDFDVKKDPTTEEGQLEIAKEDRKWYCSELVWAAYKSVGIDLDQNDSWQSGYKKGALPYEIESTYHTYSFLKSPNLFDYNPC